MEPIWKELRIYVIDESVWNLKINKRHSFTADMIGDETCSFSAKGDFSLHCRLQLPLTPTLLPVDNIYFIRSSWEISAQQRGQIPKMLGHWDTPGPHSWVFSLEGRRKWGRSSRGSMPSSSPGTCPPCVHLYRSGMLFGPHVSACSVTRQCCPWAIVLCLIQKGKSFVMK